MLIRKVCFRNWCQFKKLDVDLGPGLNGLLGHNGAGKSNFIDGVRFALTGESVNPGAKKENLTHGESRGHVEVEIEHGDTTYRVTRSIDSSKVSIRFKDVVISKASEVEDFLTRLLGTNTRSLLDNVFIPQAQIDAILNAKPAERLKGLQATFGLERAEQAYKWLGNEALAYHVTPGLADQLAAATDSALEAKNELDEKQRDVEQMRKQAAALEPAVDILRRAVEARQRHAAIQQAEQHLATAVETADAAAVSLTTAAAAASAVNALVVQMADQADVARQSLAQLQGQDAQYREAQTIQLQLTKCMDQLAALAVPPEASALQASREQMAGFQALRLQVDSMISGKTPLHQTPEDLVRVQDLADLKIEAAKLPANPVKSVEQETLEHEIRDLQSAIQAFADGICPTCGQAAHGGPEAAKARKTALQTKQGALAEMTAAAMKALLQARQTIGGRRQEVEAAITSRRDQVLAELATTQAGVAKSLAELTAFVTKGEQAVKDREALERLKAQMEGRLSGMPTQAPDPAQMQMMSTFLNQYQAASDNASQQRANVTVAQGRLDTAKQAVTNAQSIRDQVGAAVAQAPSEAEVQQATTNMENLSRIRVELTNNLDNLGVLVALSTQRNAEVTRLRARLTSEEDDTAWVNVVKRTRDTLHVTALPTIAMREYGAILNRRIAYYLELWEAPFQMWLDDAMEFRVRFPDKELSAGRLSGGQKIVASTSFRFAMSDTFARQVSLLVLDEPSERLDQDNLLILYRVLTHLKEASKHAGRQIILVTHDEGLQGFLDHTVNV